MYIEYTPVSKTRRSGTIEVVDRRTEHRLNIKNLLSEFKWNVLNVKVAPRFYPLIFVTGSLRG